MMAAKLVEITEMVHPITARRKELGMTATDLQRVSGVSRVYVFDLIRGTKNNPGIHVCVALAKALQVDLHTLAQWFIEQEPSND